MSDVEVRSLEYLLDLARCVDDWEDDCGCQCADWAVGEIKRFREALEDVAYMIEQLPSGIDYEADINDRSPEDAAAHIGGLIWQTVTKALETADEP